MSLSINDLASLILLARMPGVRKASYGIDLAGPWWCAGVGICCAFGSVLRGGIVVLLRLLLLAAAVGVATISRRRGVVFGEGGDDAELVDAVLQGVGLLELGVVEQVGDA